MTKYALSALFFIFATFGIVSVLSLQPSSQAPFYLHAHHDYDTITVRFSSQHVYVLDYHPIAMQGKLRCVYTVHHVETLSTYDILDEAKYVSQDAEFTLEYKSGTPTTLAISTKADPLIGTKSETIRYKTLP